jgi:transposase-like protein
MPRKRRYSTEQIINKLREADVLLSQNRSAEGIARLLEISKQTYYRWRKEYGGLNMTQAKKLKELEKENARLKTLVADLSLDNAIIKEALSKNKSPLQAKAPGQETTSGQRSDRCDGCI